MGARINHSSRRSRKIVEAGISRLDIPGPECHHQHPQWRIIQAIIPTIADSALQVLVIRDPSAEDLTVNRTKTLPSLDDNRAAQRRVEKSRPRLRNGEQSTAGDDLIGSALALQGRV